MYLSTSSSSPARGKEARSTAWRSTSAGLLIGLLLLAGLEAGARLIGPARFSKDLTHIQEIPRVAEENSAVLFVGSSIVRTDLDPEVLGYPRLMLDDARVATWYFALKKYFITSNRDLEVLVVGFSGDHLSRDEVNIPEVARYFSTRGDARFLFRTSQRSFGARVEYLLNRYSLFYSLRERIGKRILWTLVPDYPEAARALHRAGGMREFEEEAEFTYLEALVRLADDHGVRVVAMWLPTLKPQRERPILRAKLTSLGIDLVDLTGSHVGDESCFADALHMNEPCATRFSHEVREALAAIDVPFD